MSIRALIGEYGNWLRSQGLELGSADEHLFDTALTSAQRLWLHDFCARWDAELERQRIINESRAAAAAGLVGASDADLRDDDIAAERGTNLFDRDYRGSDFS